MKDESIRDYEVDLELYLSLAAGARINARENEHEYARALSTGSEIGYGIAISQTLFRLSLLYPTKYFLDGCKGREEYIKVRINQLIKEKTNEAKNKLHKSKKTGLA